MLPDPQSHEVPGLKEGLLICLKIAEFRSCIQLITILALNNITIAPTYEKYAKS